SADSHQGLERFPRIDEDVDLSLRGRVRRLEHQGVGGRQPEGSALGRGIDDRALRGDGPRQQHQNDNASDDPHARYASILENRHAPAATNRTPTPNNTARTRSGRKPAMSVTAKISAPWSTATVAPPSVRPIMIARRGTGATKVSFKNPNWRSHSMAIPENMAVNRTAMPITPGAMNWR